MSAQIIDSSSQQAESLFRGIRRDLRMLKDQLNRLEQAKQEAEAELASCERKLSAKEREVTALAEQLSQFQNAARVVASNKESKKKFHRGDCEFASDIIRHGRDLWFDSRHEAINTGYKPCGTCCA